MALLFGKVSNAVASCVSAAAQTDGGFQTGAGAAGLDYLAVPSALR